MYSLSVPAWCTVVALALAGPAGAQANIPVPLLGWGCKVTRSDWTVDCRGVEQARSCGLQLREQVEGACTVPAQPQATPVRLDGALRVPPGWNL